MPDLERSNEFNLLIQFNKQLFEIPHSIGLPYSKYYMDRIPSLCVLMIDGIQDDDDILKEMVPLFGLNIPSFLEKSASFIIPHLIMTRNITGLERFAQYVRSDLITICLEQDYHVLNAIFLAGANDIADFFSELLSKDKPITSQALIQSRAVLLISKLVMSLGSEAEHENVI